MTWALALQLIAALGGVAGLGAIINILVSRKKVLAEAQGIATDTSTKIIANLNADNDALRKRVSAVELDNRELRKEMSELEMEEIERSHITWRLATWSKMVYDRIGEEQKKEFGSPPVYEIKRLDKDNRHNSN